MTTYTNTDKVQERIDELVSDIESQIGDELIESQDLNVDLDDTDFIKSLLEIDSDVDGRDYSDSDVEELIDLMNFKDFFTCYNTEWNRGAPLIEQGTEEEYFKQDCSDIGDLPHNIPDYLVIDWEATAQNLLQDYTEGTIDGTTYYFRCT